MDGPPKPITPPNAGRRLVLGGGAAALAGLLACAGSFFVPANPAGVYTADDAAVYQQASATLHELTVRGDTQQVGPDFSRRLADAQSDYMAAREKLDAARANQPWLVGLLRYGGVLLTLTGVGLVLAGRRGPSS